jgi:uncharacterized membrane protein YuzA (DUF378 family)
MKILHVIAFILATVGGLNWGLIGLGGFMGKDLDVVGMVLGGMPQTEWVVFILVGLSAIYLVFTHKGSCTCCANSAPSAAPM